MAVMTLEQRVLGAVEAAQSDVVRLLAELVRFETDNPPGGNEGPAQRWMAERMRQLDLEVDLFDALPGRPNAVGVLKGTGGGHSLILNGHMDVAEVRQRETWRRDPFEPIVEGRTMYGRGTSDMKSALAAYLFVLQQLHAAGVRLRGDVIIESVMGEEAGEPGTRSCTERGYRADFAIVGEATRARQVLAAVGTMNLRITIKSPYTLHLHARRLALHAGGGLEGANCLEKMATRIVPALNELEREWAVFKRHPVIPPAQTLINPFAIRGGGNPFFMPDECALHVIVVYLPNESRDEVRQQVEEQIRRAAELDPWLRKYPPELEWQPAEYPIAFLPSDVDPGHPGVRTLLEAGREALGEPVEVGGGRGAICDSGWIAEGGTPTVVWGPGDIYWAHRVDERVNLDDVVAYARALALFLLRWCGVA
ncbi:MAG: ArgE/DapE family deacylase [Candidatus Rokubacteria bacterium]|nr:ArgE/DapE family deacylase [Candidatus Rokubacteria bacterium]